jgi:IS605 OrfB family transposase
LDNLFDDLSIAKNVLDMQKVLIVGGEPLLHTLLRKETRTACCREELRFSFLKNKIFIVFASYMYYISYMNTITYKTRLIIAEEDRPRLLAILEHERHAFNECSKRIFEHKNLSISFVHKDFYYFYKTQNPDIPTQLICEAERFCRAAYQSIKSNKHKITKPIVKKRLSVQFDQRSCSIKNQKLYLCSTEQRKQIPVSFELYPKLQHLLENYHYTPPKVNYTNGEFWCSLYFQIPSKPVYGEELAVGIDRGYVNIAATSEGIIYKDKQYLKERRKLRYLKRQLQSKGTKSSRKKLKRIRNKERNHSLNMTHNLTKKLITDTKANVLVLENLKVQKLKSKSYKQNRASQIPMSALFSILSYKALLHGKKVITVSAHYTSQIDHRTGLKDGKRLGGRYYGKDGKVLHADINAACNIALRSKLPCSISNYYAGQAVVNQPIVCKSVKEHLDSITSSSSLLRSY